MALRIEHGRPEPVEAEPAPALPTDALGDAALLALDDLVQAGDAVGDGVLAHFDADPTATHLVRHRRSGAGAEEGVENEVAGIGCNLEYVFNKAFWLWGDEGNAFSEQLIYVDFCGPIAAGHTMRKNCFRWPAPVTVREYAVISCPA